jgi:CHAT domain-containing protein/Tfp pilus assembly protein PilF
MAMQQASERMKRGHSRRGAGATAGESRLEPRLQEAQAAYDEAVRLLEAGQYASAMAQSERALSLRRAVQGDSHPELAQCFSLLGTLRHLQGDYAQAEVLLRRGLELREASLGHNDHPDVADSLNTLTNLYTDQGLYSRAELLCQRARAIREAVLGQCHPHVADSLNSLARLFARQGLFSRAEPLYQRALAIREEALGQGHPDVARTLNNLANLYREQGLPGRAEPLYERALAIREEVLGANHPLVATSLNNLATLYLDRAQYARAEALYERALSIQEAALGGDHPDVARTLSNLAALHARQGAYSLVEELSARALAIREAALGHHHPDIAYCLDNLAGRYKAQGSYDLAEPLYQRSLAIREATLGSRHPLVAETLGRLGQLQCARGHLDEALPLFWRAFVMSEQRLRQEALDFSNSRLSSFLQFLRTGEERLYALLRAHPEDAGVRRLALSAALLLKGRCVEEAADTSRTIYRSLGEQDRTAFEQLRELRTQLAALALQGPGALSPADHQQRLKELAEQGDALEAGLARRSAPLRAMAALPSPDEIVDHVAAALPRDGALVELIAYADRPFLSQPGAGSAQLRYLALVLFPDASTRALDLGPAEPIDQLASRLRNALAIRDASFLESAQALYALAFQPLLPLLGKAHRLFLSTDGQLALVPFAALHDGERFLIDSFDLTYLTSGKELLPRMQDTAASCSVVVMADPDFSASRQPRDVESGSSPRTEQAERPWVPLPGTRQEAEALQRLMPQAQLFLGAEATKERLLSLSAPGVLHLATHGFFLGDAAPTPPGSRAVVHFGALGQNTSAPRPSDPLLRSGLVLATGSASGAEDSEGSCSLAHHSMVTALELAGLDLWGTQLVVLSACDTGRGEVKLGQGVYGLRRAFIIAGAETVVMSLWKVNDETTRALMEAYYGHLLAGQGRGSALREAMRSVRESQPHPHFWAPFIVQGSDAPLRALEPGVERNARLAG